MSLLLPHLYTCGEVNAECGACRWVSETDFKKVVVLVNTIQRELDGCLEDDAALARPCCQSTLTDTARRIRQIIEHEDS